jgi:K+-sensing histidine kinase KdpD
MPNSEDKTLVQIERAGWLMWLMAFALILALAIAVYLLGVTMITALKDSMQQQSAARAYYAGVGLVGLVCIFILYTIHKRLQLRNVQLALLREEAELKDTRSRLAEISKMFELATTLNLRLSVQSILNILVRRVVAALKAQQASVMLYNSATDALETRAYYGVEGEFTSSGRVRIGESIAGKVAQTCQPLLLTDQTTATDLKQFFKPHRNITSALSVPLLSQGQCLGVLNVNRINHPELFNDQRKEILRLFAEHIAAVIERAEEMDSLSQRAKDLERANDRLREMNKVKEVFLSTASHELKTPLTSVIGYAEILNDHDARLHPEQRLEFTRRLRTEAKQLLGLIEDILDLTRLETGKIELRRSKTRVEDLVRAAAETSRSMASTKSVSLVEDYEEVEAISVDEVKIRQALVNLIVNAIKFSPENGVVKISIRDEGPEVTIDVTDQGPGIASHESSQIFTLFGQGITSGTKTPSGLGIGLHLVKRIVELHGGRVGVSSAHSAGSTFWLRLPKEEAGQEAKAA